MKGKYAKEVPEIGTRLVRVRESLGLKQNRLAETLEITPSMLSRYEKGRFPPLQILKKVSAIGNVNLHWLLTGEGPPTLERGVLVEESPEEWACPTEDQSVEAQRLAEAATFYRKNKRDPEELRELEALQGVMVGSFPGGAEGSAHRSLPSSAQTVGQ